jgi:hypothetical protein
VTYVSGGVTIVEARDASFAREATAKPLKRAKGFEPSTLTLAKKLLKIKCWRLSCRTDLFPEVMSKVAARKED